MGDYVKQHTMFDLVQDELGLVEKKLAAVIESEDDILTEMGVHLLRAGGKRLRPALYFLCAKARCMEEHGSIPIAAAIELIHMATLVHDDVLDNASTRRSHPTANARWGNHASVLAGDYLFAKAFSLVAGDGNKTALSILTNEICAICEGEIAQIRDNFNINQDEKDYLVRIRKKTAGFIAASCELGAIAAGLSNAEIKSLYNYGLAVGMAFQITDDIFDVTASAEQIGKPVGNDLKQGILTLPVIYALTHGSRRDELVKLIAGRDMSEDKHSQCMDIVLGTDAVEYSYQKVAEYLAIAKANLPKLIGDDVGAVLLTVADFIGLRKY
ncbi:MAG: hepT [Firmicutes bacterium]|nr:hepT [Bacillota bacterium]